jgi:SpoVK/Ycf46/Vps4 family AAA+-type ATPase
MSSPPPPNDPNNVVAFDVVPLKRGPGRPRSFQRAPTLTERARRENVRERLREHVARDATVTAISKPMERESTARLDLVMREIALEAASLGWDSQRALVEGRRDAERLASRRIAALERIGQLALERARAGVEDGHVNPHHPKVQRLVAWFLGELAAAANETLAPSDAEKFLARFNELSAGWEQKVEQ